MFGLELRVLLVVNDTTLRPDSVMFSKRKIEPQNNMICTTTKVAREGGANEVRIALRSWLGGSGVVFFSITFECVLDTSPYVACTLFPPSSTPLFFPYLLPPCNKPYMNSVVLLFAALLDDWK